jgi:hypothetical protein
MLPMKPSWPRTKHPITTPRNTRNLAIQFEKFEKIMPTEMMEQYKLKLAKSLLIYMTNKMFSQFIKTKLLRKKFKYPITIKIVRRNITIIIIKQMMENLLPKLTKMQVKTIASSMAIELYPVMEEMLEIRLLRMNTRKLLIQKEQTVLKSQKEQTPQKKQIPQKNFQWQYHYTLS